MKNKMNRLNRILAFAFVLIFSVGTLCAPVMASSGGLYVTNDMEEGTYLNSFISGGIEVRATVNSNVEVRSFEQEKMYNEYKFSKALYFKDAGNTNYFSLRANVYKGTDSVIVFAQSASEEEATIVLATVNGEVETATIKPESAEQVTKVVFSIPDEGIYYIYCKGPAYIYATYFGGISETEQEAMGKKIVHNDPYYMLVGQYQEEGRENVFAISFLIFLITIIIAVVLLNVKKGKRAVRRLFRETPKKKDNMIYKE